MQLPAESTEDEQVVSSFSPTQNQNETKNTINAITDVVSVPVKVAASIEKKISRVRNF
jgi:hypothetical protein